MDLELTHEAAVALRAVAGAEADRQLVVREDGMIANSADNDGEPESQWFPLSSLNVNVPDRWMPGRAARRARS